jgi:DNA/RNA endonuclease YhcR with UshA esterase domain
MGEQVTVEGTVIRTHNSGNVVFLNFSPEPDDSFVAVIFPDDWPKFPAPPEDLFYGKLVRIEGVIEAYQGKPEIIIRDPWQIEVALTLGQPVVTQCDCRPETVIQAQSEPTMTVTVSTADSFTPAVQATAEVTTPANEAAPADHPVISWQDAGAYDGQVVTIEGQVVTTYNSGKVVFLNFAEAYQTAFKVVIFPDAWPLFPAPPEEHFLDQTVQVTGRIEMYQNAPEIIVDHPDQIKITRN